jgi:hypothetical protein
MTYLEGADFFVRVIDLPPRVGGFCSPNEDGTYNVYLNIRKDRDHNIDSYFHEVDHIEDDDFWNDESIEEVEGLGSKPQ